jgi:hypothetical protein
VEVVRIDGRDAGWEQDPDPQGIGSAENFADPPELPLVLVTWRDAWFDFDEPDPQEARSDYLVNTVGFLVQRGPRFVSVAQEVLPDGDGFRAVTHIPLAVVEKISPLTPDEAQVNDLAAP